MPVILFNTTSLNGQQKILMTKSINIKTPGTPPASRYGREDGPRWAADQPIRKHWLAKAHVWNPLELPASGLESSTTQAAHQKTQPGHDNG